MILSAKIAYLKAFNEQQTVDFASDGNASASKLTLLVGPNNSGKSSLINILDGILHPRDNVFTASKEHRHGDNPPQVKVKCGPQEIALVEGTGSKYKVTGLSNEISSKVKFVPSRRPWTEAYSDPLDDAGYSSSYRHNRRANPGWLDSLFAGALGKLSTAPERKAAFNKLLTSVDPDIQDWRPENYAGQDFIEYQAKNGLWHRIGDVGDGVGSLFRICFELVHLRGGETLLVDEPELSLHPQVQRRLASAMLTKSYGCQIIIATHSPHFVSWKALKAGAQVHRLNMTDKGCSVSSLSGTTLKTIISIADTDRKNVMLYDAVAKEIFFSRGALFVEGAEDANILRSYVEQQGGPEIEIFGYGSGGHGNIATWLRMCTELGIRGFGLYDGDADSSASQANAAATFANNPKIEVEKLPTADIRDKWDDAGTTLKEEGAFDKDWKIKPKYQDAVDGILAKVRNHLSGT